jgi:hypothetical protein
VGLYINTLVVREKRNEGEGEERAPKWEENAD